MTPEEIREARIRKRRLAKNRFKSLVRKVALNIYWLQELEDLKLGDNVKRNIAILTRKQTKKSVLTLQERAILNTPIHVRTLEQKRRAVSIISSLKCFERYPPKIRGRLSKIIAYQYYGPNRVIIREGHHASAMYFILEGEITVSKKRWVPLDEEYVDMPISTLGSGDLFGDVALMHNRKRMASCTTAADTELMCVFKEDFDLVLKTFLLNQSEQIVRCMGKFENFNQYTEDQSLECCIMSKINQYSPNETVYAEDKLREKYAFFVLSGSCMILQSLRIMTHVTRKGHKRYELVKEEESESQSKMLLSKIHANADRKRKSIGPNEKLSYNNKSDDKVNVQTAQTNKPSAVGQQQSSYEFVEVGSFNYGSFFGLGEEMTNRTIVARNYVQCLVVPRYWLFLKAQNAGNIWERAKIFLNSSIPSKAQCFEMFKKDKQWQEYKRNLVLDVVKRNPNKNITMITDVPIVCRIDNGL